MSKCSALGIKAETYRVKVHLMKCLCRDRGAVEVQQLGSRRRLMISTTPRTLYPRKRPATPCIAGRVAPRAGLDDTKNLVYSGIPSPECPAYNESLCV